MRFIFFLVFTSVFSFNGNSQFYSLFGVKAQKFDFLTVYEDEGDFYYDPSQNQYVPEIIVDSLEENFFTVGPSAGCGYKYHINDQFAIGGDIDGTMGMANFPGTRVCLNFGLGVKTSYTIGSGYSSVFLRLGVGYGMIRNNEPNYNLVGFNWQVGYEYDFEMLNLGLMLEGNVFLEDLTKPDFYDTRTLLSRKANSLGASIYISWGGDSEYH